ncbi:MAG: bifunctional precorrin-2 dehydrogenase/sirohydrochlorin ferrochelatase [Eubacteriales bacterium]|nr:bifunctional precorrin-2 dehydrogenase/sirohydrochlorin ferrochelatase [Eubacteriales bacterium]
MSKYFPMFVDISEAVTVVVGGGTIASRRVRTIAEFCNHVTVVAPEVTDDIRQLEEEGRLSWKQKTYEREDILNADMVLACTDQPEINKDIYAACKCLGIRVNNCSDKKQCDFYFPGVITAGDTVVGVNAGGNDHRKAKEITQKIRQVLEEPKNEE